MSNPCPQCGEEDWDAYLTEHEGWRLWCRSCEFDEHEDDHVHRLCIRAREEEESE